MLIHEVVMENQKKMIDLELTYKRKFGDQAANEMIMKKEIDTL